VSVYSELTEIRINRVNATCLESSVEMGKVHTSVTFKCVEIDQNRLIDASALYALTEDLRILCRTVKVFKLISMLVIQASQV
jgi:hypothetical protein